jgi:hypothetical protein
MFGGRGQSRTYLGLGSSIFWFSGSSLQRLGRAVNGALFAAECNLNLSITTALLVIRGTNAKTVSTAKCSQFEFHNQKVFGSRPMKTVRELEGICILKALA